MDITQAIINRKHVADKLDILIDWITPDLLDAEHIEIMMDYKTSLLARFDNEIEHAKKMMTIAHDLNQIEGR